MKEQITHFSSVRKQPDSNTYLFPHLRIVLISKGALKWLIGKKEYLCNEGDIIFLNNSFERKITEVLVPDSIIDIFEFPPYILSEDTHLIEKFYTSDSCIIKSTSSVAHKITGFLKEIAEENKSNNSFKNDYVLNLLKAALVLSLRDNQKESHKIHTDSALKATLFIWKNLHEDINAETVSKNLGVNQSVLESNFRKIHGRSIASYIRMFRVYRVARAIKNTDRNILDIAFENGFKSSSGFYKTFHSIYKMSPKEYLKTIR